MIGLVIIVILMGLVFQKYQAYQRSQQLKVVQLAEEQKRIVEEQRKAIGYLPEVKLSEKTENALKSASPTPPIQMQQPQSVNTDQNFSCDGRQHCSQMHSYEEAVFFLRNCPNTKMDGDGDGIPCEQQFGRY